MAVPSSGPISMLGLAREKVYDNYSSTSTPTAPYSLLDLTTASDSVMNIAIDATNTNSPSYPNNTAPHAMSEWRSYDHDAVSNITMTLYMDNYLSTSDTPNYLQVYVDGTLYQVTNGTQTSYSVSVPPSTSVSFSAFSEYVTSQSAHSLEMYDESNLYESDYGTTPSLSFNYTTPSSNFNMYASAY